MSLSPVPWWTWGTTWAWRWWRRAWRAATATRSWRVLAATPRRATTSAARSRRINLRSGCKRSGRSGLREAFGFGEEPLGVAEGLVADVLPPHQPLAVYE